MFLGGLHSYGITVMRRFKKTSDIRKKEVYTKGAFKIINFKQNEGYYLRFNRIKLNEIEKLQEEIQYYKSDNYKMEIAMPYIENIEKLQERLNESMHTRSRLSI